VAKSLFEIEGFAEFQRKIEQLPDKMKRNELNKVLRRVAKPTVAAAKRHVPVKEGRLQRSIGTITGKSRTYPNILVGPRAKGKHGGFHGALVEFGHGGPSPAPAHPYMRPAIDETRGQVSSDAADKIAKYLQKTIDRLSK